MSSWTAKSRLTIPVKTCVENYKKKISKQVANYQKTEDLEIYLKECLNVVEQHV